MAYTPYEPTDWKNLPDEETPITKDSLNKIEQAINNMQNNAIFYEAIGEIDETTGAVTYYEATQTVSEDTE